MPRTSSTRITNSIPRLYQHSALSLLMYGYVVGVRDTIHTITIKDAIEMFMECFDLSESDYNTESAYSTFINLQKQQRDGKSD